MFKKLKTVMMIMFVIGMTMLMSSAGCDNAADSGGGSSSRQPILKSKNGSTLIITHDDPIDVVSGSFSLSLVEADRKGKFTFSEGQGTWTTLGNGAITFTSPSSFKADFYCGPGFYWDDDFNFVYKWMSYARLSYLDSSVPNGPVHTVIEFDD